MKALFLALFLVVGCVPTTGPESQSDQFAYVTQNSIKILIERASVLQRGGTLSSEDYLRFLDSAEELVNFVDELESQADLLDGAMGLSNCVRFDANGDGACNREDVTLLLQDLSRAVE